MIQMTSKPYTQESPDTAGVVYIVEDDEAVRDSLKWLLEASSYRVELFESGEMFLAKFDPNAIAVLVLDEDEGLVVGLRVIHRRLKEKGDGRRTSISFTNDHSNTDSGVFSLAA